ncbi:peptide chain release factor 3 [Pantoea sp. Aalb]|uniref:peptide chain release factor 3 n=1 Tax=Pantoea sp. Aalb TaxID=2576762 RepID=UPI001321F8F3|nr:peptide chain release factor 3 [Pantoea sp. Aalb]MXP67712.1 peptide chain release factor 3 [Pantoea sp. Aalb]
MSHSNFLQEIMRRRTFAIISHPDAGKTTITEKMLSLRQQNIYIYDKGKKHDTKSQIKSDWMQIEKQRGISITTSVIQFLYRGIIINLLDTPGHNDFSEDTYRTLTAVDCCLLVIDATKGIESRTRQLIKVTRLRNTPIITFMNKLDREIYDPIKLLDLVENELKITCVPITWPISYGKEFKGVYHLYNDETYLYTSKHYKEILEDMYVVKGLYNPKLDKVIGIDLAKELRNTIAIMKGVLPDFDKNMFLNGKITPVFFGSAMCNFGVNHVLDSFIPWAPIPLPRNTKTRTVESKENKFTGFIFKIQANMDLKHRDRIAFMRVVSGIYNKGMKLYQVRTGKNIIVSDALIFMASNRFQITKAYPGDIIGLHNHGTIQIGDTFTQGENLQFINIPNFAPELFRRVLLCNPFNQKKLVKGLIQLSEEGAIQVFRPLNTNAIIIGAIGILQFEVVIVRLKTEYNIDIIYESVSISAIRWIECNDVKKFIEFKNKNESNLALDANCNLAYIAPTMVNLSLIQERYPDVIFRNISDH